MPDVMAEPFKMNVKLPGGEFSAEGTEQSVTAQFKLWLDAMASAKPTVRADVEQAFTPPPPPGALNGGGSNSSVNPQIIDRVYKVDAGKRSVSLNVLPKTDERDAD